MMLYLDREYSHQTICFFHLLVILQRTWQYKYGSACVMVLRRDVYYGYPALKVHIHFPSLCSYTRVNKVCLPNFVEWNRHSVLLWSVICVLNKYTECCAHCSWTWWHRWRKIDAQVNEGNLMHQSGRRSKKNAIFNSMVHASSSQSHCVHIIRWETNKTCLYTSLATNTISKTPERQVKYQ